MLIELPSLARRVKNNAPWQLRRLSLPKETILQGSLSKISIYFYCCYDEWRNSRYQQIPVSLDLDIGISVQIAQFLSRGRFKQQFPTGEISFFHEGKLHKYNLVFELCENEDHGELKNITDLTMAEIFDGECWNYSLLNSLTNVCLRSRQCIASLRFTKGRSIKTKALLIEDIEFAQKARGNLAVDLSEGPIEAVDIFNLHLLQTMVGNSDYFFDYNDSQFVAHNVAAFQLQESLVPFPFDLQFCAVLTPLYQRHRHLTIAQEARIKAETIICMMRTLPEYIDMSYVKHTIAHAITHLKAPTLSKSVLSRYETYLHCLDGELKKTISQRSKNVN